jgi:cysteine desulfurase
MFGFKISEVATKTGASAKSEGRPIYLDMQATTPMDPRVLDKMLPYFTEQYGNPHSRTHAYGWEAESAVDEARQHIADLIGAGSKDVVFTSGATESNNMIIKGIAKFHQGKRKHIITTQTVGYLFSNLIAVLGAEPAGTQMCTRLVPISLEHGL